MEDKSNVSIFQGSTVEADTVHDFLAQQGIGSLVRNHMQETLDAGWLTASPDYAAEVFVSLEDEARAVELLKNLYQEEGFGNHVHSEQADRSPVSAPQQRLASENQSTPPSVPPST